MTTILDNLSVFQKSELLDALGRRGGILAFAQKYGLNADSLRGALSRAGGAEALQIEVSEEVVPPSPQAINTLRQTSNALPRAANIVQPPAHFKLQKFAYASDFHAPYHSTLWVERLYKVGYHLEIPTLVIAGDLFDFDNVSRHGSDIQSTDLNKTLEIGGQVVRYLHQVFETIVVLPGNHDRRLMKKLDRDLSWANVLRMAVGNMDGIVSVEQDYLCFDDQDGRTQWIGGHPSFFSSRPTVGLQQVALLRQAGILGSHNHIQGMSKVNDKFWVIDPGCMCDRTITPYIQRGAGLSRFQDWSNGFLVIDDNLPQLFADGLTRWSDFE